MSHVAPPRRFDFGFDDDDVAMARGSVAVVDEAVVEEVPSSYTISYALFSII